MLGFTLRWRKIAKCPKWVDGWMDGSSQVLASSGQRSKGKARGCSCFWGEDDDVSLRLKCRREGGGEAALRPRGRPSRWRNWDGGLRSLCDYLERREREAERAGTLRQCRSRKFQKCVRKQSEIGQKTVSYIKLSEICPKCVRKVSKMCQIQNYVKNVSDQNQKCLRNVSKVKNVSEKHQF